MPLKLPVHFFKLLLLPALIGLTVIVFFPTFFNDFQRGWDDNWQVLNNPYVLNQSFDSLQYHFYNFYKGQYSPVNTLLYIFTYNVFGFSPTAFHMLCLFLHLANIALVYTIVRDLVAHIQPKYSSSRLSAYAFIVALVFALHPLQVESVAWISASKVVLYAFFTLVALGCYIKYLKTYQWNWLIGVAIAYLLGFGSKEQAIILPLNLLVLDYAYGRFKNFNFKKFHTYSRVLFEKLPFFALALGLWYFSSVNNVGALDADGIYPVYQRMLLGAHSVTEYIFRFLAPVKLYYFYFFPIEAGQKLPWYYWSYLIFIVIIGAFAWNHYKRGNKIVLFGLLFFLVNILLVLHILPMPRKMVSADRYMYLSVLGLALVLAWYIDYVYHHYSRYKKYLVFAVGLYIVALGIQSFYRTQEWKDSASIKSNIKKLIEKRKQAEQPVINNPLTNE